MCKTFSLFYPRGQNMFFMCETEQKLCFFLSWIWCHTWKKILKRTDYSGSFFMCENKWIYFSQNNVTNKNSECLSARIFFFFFVMCETEWSCLYFILFKVIFFVLFVKMFSSTSSDTWIILLEEKWIVFRTFFFQVKYLLHM